MVVPPLKIQGKKTKLVPEIMELVESILKEHPEIDTWVEPFFGTGVVGFNCPEQIKYIIAGDTNPHIVKFYTDINNGIINATNVNKELHIHSQNFLTSEENGYVYYRELVKLFNGTHDSMLFLVLTRTSFNGLMRFNKKGEWNVPYCKDNTKLNDHLIEKLCTEITHLYNLMKEKHFSIKNQGYELTLSDGQQHNSIVYCDPPYYGLYTTYYNDWNQSNEENLSITLSNINKPYIVSTWYNNGVKDNECIAIYWNKSDIKLIGHKYIVGADKSNRRNVIEALLYKA